VLEHRLIVHLAGFILSFIVLFKYLMLASLRHRSPAKFAFPYILLKLLLRQVYPHCRPGPFRDFDDLEALP
jgi:hypothetical protein